MSAATDVAFQLNSASAGSEAVLEGVLRQRTGAKVKYKGSTGDKPLNMRISSTAWNKIHCARTALGKSMSRLMQDLLLHYKPLTPEQLAKQRECQQLSLIHI